jgi:hypothetical protein
LIGTYPARPGPGAGPRPPYLNRRKREHEARCDERPDDAVDGPRWGVKP